MPSDVRKVYDLPASLGKFLGLCPESWGRDEL